MSKSLRRIQHGDWFIQSQKGVNHFIAWASKDRTQSPLDASIGDVYFQIKNTEEEAVKKLISELDALPNV